MHTKKHTSVLIFVSPLMGGALVSSAMSWMFTVAGLNSAMDWLSKMIPQMQEPAGGPWIKFLLLLVVPESPDVGLFGNTPFETFTGKWNLDRVCGLAFWFVLFIIGGAVQYSRFQKRRIQKKAEGLGAKVGAAS